MKDCEGPIRGPGIRHTQSKPASCSPLPPALRGPRKPCPTSGHKHMQAWFAPDQANLCVLEVAQGCVCFSFPPGDASMQPSLRITALETVLDWLSLQSQTPFTEGSALFFRMLGLWTSLFPLLWPCLVSWGDFKPQVSRRSRAITSRVNIVQLQYLLI